ncbi:peptidoglycan DD-metalloendopeptidase family protein [Glutamicibacter creatinolyticus]|uniref:peptidoglycan DD-metalloendopeptidase family protein n=1 Tax=Glutamicibacter creatinolyticus TaxID=162496 RepID=UPI003217C674
MATPAEFIAALRAHTGTRYTYGGKTPATGFDCSGLITFALSEVGVGFVHGSINQINACTPISVAEALKTPGALLWFPGHDAISLGNGRTIEAVTTPRDGVAEYPHGNRFTKAGLIPGINYKEETPMSKMVSPFQGRITQNHERSGGYKGHAGMDIAPPKPGQVGMPVYAAFAGTVKKVHRTAKHGNKNSTWAPRRTGNGILIANPDGEGNGYNHMRPLDHLSVGEWVEAGQLIGYNDTSGTQTGPHLHFELWANWMDSNSHYDPRLAFDKFKVTPGSAPSLTSIGVTKPAGNTPAPKAPSAAVKKKLKAMGYTKQGVAEVKAYQAWHGLLPDGDWAGKTEAKYQEVVRAQNATKKMKNVPNNWASDGYWGATSKKWAAYTSGRNGWNNPNGWLTKKYISNLKKVKAW